MRKLILSILSLAFPFFLYAQSGDLNAPVITVRISEFNIGTLIQEMNIDYGNGRSEQIDLSKKGPTKAYKENQAIVHNVLLKLYANNYYLEGTMDLYYGSMMIFRKKE